MELAQQGSPSQRTSSPAEDITAPAGSSSREPSTTGKMRVTWSQPETDSHIVSQSSPAATASQGSPATGSPSKPQSLLERRRQQQQAAQQQASQPLSLQTQQTATSEEDDRMMMSAEYDDGPDHQAALAASAPQSQAPSDITADQHQPGIITGTPQPTAIVDLVEAARKLREGLSPDPHQYINHLKANHPKPAYPDNLRPSVLESKSKAGANSYKSVLQPTWAKDGQGFTDLQHDDSGQLLPLKNIWQFQLSLVKAINVGSTGFGKQRYPVRHVARACIFDRQHHRFLGNVFPVLCTDVRGKEADWVFNPANAAVVRCSQVQPARGGGSQQVEADKLSLYVELNVAYRLTGADADVVPEEESKAVALSEELCTCWALINMRRCCELARELEVAVPLYYGSIYDPQLLHNLAAEKRRLHPIKTLFSSRAPPALKFRVAPLGGSSEQQQPIVAYHHMPPTMIAHPHVAYALGAYRLLAAQHLAKGTSPLAAFGDAVLASFPQLLADQQLLAEFLSKWHACCTQLAGDNRGAAPRGGCSPRRGTGAAAQAPSTARVVATFQRCVLELAPLLHCLSLPAPHMANFMEYQEHRAALLRQLTSKVEPRTGAALPRHPSEVLSAAEGCDYLHRPFNVAETRCSWADGRQ